MGIDLQANQDFLKEVGRRSGIDLLGVADIRKQQGCFYELPGELLARLFFAVVIGVRVSPTVLDTLKDGPNAIYYHHYRQLNFLLDRVALKIAGEIEKLGYGALPIPASQIIDWNKMIGHASHKKLAQLAGLGWRGRNNLLVTEKWGAQLRLASILTDFPLEPSDPVQRDCGSCQACLSACPAKAIKEEITAFDYIACYNQLKEFARTLHRGQHICGLCVKACCGSGTDERKI